MTTGPPEAGPFGAFRRHLGSLDPSALDEAQVAETCASIASVRAALDALEVRLVRRRRTLAESGHSAAPTEAMVRSGERSSRSARAVDERSQACDRFPTIEDSLADGRLSAEHVDAVAAATRQLDDHERGEFAESLDDLLASTTRAGVDGFERACRRLARSIVARNDRSDGVDQLDRQRARSHVRRWIDRSTGMHHTHLELDPVRDAAIWSAIDATLADQRRRPEQAGRPWAQLQVDAVVAAVSSAAGGTGRRRVPELVVLVDLETLTGSTHDDQVCETAAGVPLPAGTVRAMACEADLVPVVLGGDSQALDVGRARRLATEAQRRALLAMHRTCVHPDCTVPVDACRIHHVRPWSNGGRTDLAELVPVCEPHHHDLHERGWSMTIDARRQVTWHRPDGVEHATSQSVDRRAPVGAAATG